MRIVVILFLSAGLWLAASAAGAQTCPGEEFEKPGLTAACENGVMVYRGYAKRPFRHSLYHRPDRDMGAPYRKEAAESGEMEHVSIRRHYFWAYLPDRRATPPDTERSDRLVWQAPAPRARMVRLDAE